MCRQQIGVTKLLAVSPVCQRKVPSIDQASGACPRRLEQ